MYNEVLLIGWIVRPAELKQPGSGEKHFASTSLSTKRRWRDLNGMAQEKTTFHTIEAWEDRAQILAEAAPGDLIMVEGYIENEVHDGKFHSSVVAQKIMRLKTKDQGRLTRRGSLVDIVESLDDHDREVLLKLLLKAMGRN
jgi:single-stranded DNA-binding protein